MAGLVLSGTAVRKRVERLVLPLRDAFGALFFFHFGLIIDPGEIGKVALPAFAAVCTSLLLALVAAVGAARLNHMGRVEAANIAFSVVARGEFALILAVLATNAGLDQRLTPFVGVYVLALAIISPVLSMRSESLARLIPARLLPAVATVQP
jgi:CPA2 family monovalent cation:H+ antiporter-2